MFVDPEPNGLADLVGRLIAGNLAAEPARQRLVGTASIELDASDADVSARLRLEPGRVTVANGRRDGSVADLSVSAGASDLLALAGAPLLFGFPSVLRRDGRDVLRRVLTRRVRIRGMLRHPVLLSRFARLLSVA